MLCAKSKDEFDIEVIRILSREFRTIVEAGLLSEEVLIPAVTGVRCSLREAFPEMSAEEAEFHLKQLQDQCREMAYSIFKMSYTTYWN